MDKTKRETHDFMNVHSFSQLPFIRPPSIPSKEKAVRLFGIEFNDELNSTETLPNAVDLDSNNSSKVNAEESSSSIRRFECHYCCRKFPTSQALGGHQNAHKRERQHAKRAHIHAPSALSEGYVYGYHRFGSTYPTWNSGNANAVNSGGRYYGSSYSHPQAINGNPFGLWRFPTATVNVPNSSFFSRERSLRPLTLLAGEETNTRMGPTRVGIVRPSGSQSRYVYDSKRSVNEHVSLDLHL